MAGHHPQRQGRRTSRHLHHQYPRPGSAHPGAAAAARSGQTLARHQRQQPARLGAKHDRRLGRIRHIEGRPQRRHPQAGRGAQPRGISVNAASPGWVRTEMGTPPSCRKFQRRLPGRPCSNSLRPASHMPQSCNTRSVLSSPCWPHSSPARPPRRSRRRSTRRTSRRESRRHSVLARR